MANMRWTTADIPDQSGKVAIVTGANSGLGYETSLALAEKNATVIMGVRTLAKGEKAAEAIRAQTSSGTLNVMALDLASLDSVKAFASAFLDQYDRLDILINNAGIMMVPESTTADGFEAQVGTNHLGHFALTGRLLKRLDATPGARVINVSSLAANSGEIELENLMGHGNYNRQGQYGKSKLANLLFTRGLQERIEKAGMDIVVAAAHPGGSNTNLANGIEMNPIVKRLALSAIGLLMQSAAQGALPQLYVSTAEGVQGNDYYGPDGWNQIRGYPTEVSMPAQAFNRVDIDGLWRLSEELTDFKYPF